MLFPSPVAVVPRNVEPMQTCALGTALNGATQTMWSAAEDQRLLDLVRVHGTHWGRILLDLPGRTKSMCRGRLARMRARPSPDPTRTRRRRCGKCHAWKRGHLCPFA